MAQLLRKRGTDGPSPHWTRTSYAWVALLVLIVGTFGTTVASLDRSLYSASGFVSTYLDALARKDVKGALATSGVTVPDGLSTAFLTADALGGLSEVHTVSENVDKDGIHHVVVRSNTDGEDETTTFFVKRRGTSFGYFPTWTFAQTPVSTVEVTVSNAKGFRVNGYPGLANTQGPQPGNYVAVIALLSPGRYDIDHDSQYLTAPPVSVVLKAPSSTATAAITVVAKQGLVDAVQKNVNDYLGSCVTQQVLQPSGCPFGKFIADRIQGVPTWSMVTYPQVSLVAKSDASGNITWVVPPSAATAHLTVRVQSLFDGTISDLEEDIPFDVSYTVAVGDDGVLQIVGV